MESNSVCNDTSDNKIIGFVYHEYDYRPNWTTQSLPVNHTNYNFREQNNSQVIKERKICIKRLIKGV